MAIVRGKRLFHNFQADAVGSLVLLAFLVSFHFLLRAKELVAIAGADSAVVVVGRFDTMDPFASGVADAVKDAAIRDREPIEVVLFNTAPYVRTEGGSHSVSGKLLTWRLHRVLATNNVTAVIDASTSSVAPIVLTACAQLGIPVLETVATNNPVLEFGQGASLRMPGNDSVQGQIIEKWLAEKTDTLILSDGSPYADFLRRELLEHGALDEGMLAGLEVSPGSNLVSIFSDFQARGMTSVLYVGYGDFIAELLAAHALAIPDIPLLLSDGSYSAVLSNMPHDSPKVYISIPSGGEAMLAKHPYGAFGRDAYLLVKVAGQRLRILSQPRKYFFPTLIELGRSGVGIGLSQDYCWDSTSGENSSGTFEIVKLKTIRER